MTFEPDAVPSAGLLASAAELPPWLVTAHVRRHALARGAAAVEVLLQDYDQKMLVPLTEEAFGEAATGGQPIDGSPAGEAFATMRPVSAADASGAPRLFLPLLTGGDRVGVLGLTLGSGDDAGHGGWEEFAAAVAHLIVAKGQHTDVYFRARRRKDMTLAAEMQWHLLPPMSVVDPRVAIAGSLEPAYEVGGDAFDYAINHETAHIAVFDAMGHGLDAAVMSAVAVGAYRHGRRAGIPTEELYTLVDGEFAREFGGEKFVTAQLATLQLRTGGFVLVNAGHPAPLHLRGGRVLGPITAPTTLPIGLADPSPQVAVTQLEPGDRVLLYSDGVTEARQDGKVYGEERLVRDVEQVLADPPPLPEVIRRLNLRLLEWRGGPPSDDSTVVLLEWRTPHLPAAEA